MKRLWLVLALALLPACDEKVTYSYFVVAVRLDMTVDPPLRDRIYACAVTAETPVRQDSADLRCKFHMVTSELGTFEYTTTLTSGSVVFRLIAHDFNRQPLVRGETKPIDILVGGKVDAELVGSAVPGAKPEPELPPDAGAPADTAPPPADTAPPPADAAAADAGTTG